MKKPLPETVEELFKPEPTKFEQVAERIKAESEPCVHFAQDCKTPELDNCEEYLDYQGELAKETSEPYYVDPEWGSVEKEISETVLARREYFERIDRLLDAVMPCDGATLDDTVRLAIGILGRCIREEAGE